MCGFIINGLLFFSLKSLLFLFLIVKILCKRYLPYKYLIEFAYEAAKPSISVIERLLITHNVSLMAIKLVMFSLSP